MAYTKPQSRKRPARYLSEEVDYFDDVPQPSIGQRLASSQIALLFQERPRFLWVNMIFLVPFLQPLAGCNCGVMQHLELIAQVMGAFTFLTLFGNWATGLMTRSCDRQTPRIASRPIASGKLSTRTIVAALIISGVGLIAIATALSTQDHLDWRIAALMAISLLMRLAYAKVVAQPAIAPAVLMAMGAFVMRYWVAWLIIHPQPGSTWLVMMAVAVLAALMTLCDKRKYLHRPPAPKAPAKVGHWWNPAPQKTSRYQSRGANRTHTASPRCVTAQPTGHPAAQKQDAPKNQPNHHSHQYNFNNPEECFYAIAIAALVAAFLAIGAWIPTICFAIQRQSTAQFFTAMGIFAWMLVAIIHYVYRNYIPCDKKCADMPFWDFTLLGTLAILALCIYTYLY